MLVSQRLALFTLAVIVVTINSQVYIFPFLSNFDESFQEMSPSSLRRSFERIPVIVQQVVVL